MKLASDELTAPEGAAIIPISLMDKLRLERVEAWPDVYNWFFLLCVPTFTAYPPVHIILKLSPVPCPPLRGATPVGYTFSHVWIRMWPQPSAGV